MTQSYKPDQPEGSLSYLTRYVLICLVAIGVIIVLGFIRSPNSYTGTVIMIALVTTLWTNALLRKKVIQEFQLNIEEQTLTVFYFTLTGLKREITFDIKSDRITYERNPSRLHPSRWTLELNGRNGARVKISDNEFGFHKALLERLAKAVSTITADKGHTHLLPES